MHIKPIGTVSNIDGAQCIELNSPFKDGLTNIDGFSHLQVIWWGHLFEGEEYRSHVVAEKPYKKGPGRIGVFATRSPVRPNPLLITNIKVDHIDFKQGIIYTPYIDAEEGTPILDIKPYNKGERIRDCTVPEWCAHWPEWDEDSAHFNWQDEFNF